MLIFTGTIIGGITGIMTGIYLQNTFNHINIIRHDAIYIGFIHGSLIGFYISSIIEINKLLLF
jgi:hypothetical protein